MGMKSTKLNVLVRVNFMKFLSVNVLTFTVHITAKCVKIYMQYFSHVQIKLNLSRITWSMRSALQELIILIEKFYRSVESNDTFFFLFLSRYFSKYQGKSTILLYTNNSIIVRDIYEMDKNFKLSKMAKFFQNSPCSKKINYYIILRTSEIQSDIIGLRLDHMEFLEGPHLLEAQVWSLRSLFRSLMLRWKRQSYHFPWRQDKVQTLPSRRILWFAWRTEWLGKIGWTPLNQPLCEGKERIIMAYLMSQWLPHRNIYHFMLLHSNCLLVVIFIW